MNYIQTNLFLVGDYTRHSWDVSLAMMMEESFFKVSAEPIVPSKDHADTNDYTENFCRVSHCLARHHLVKTRYSLPLPSSFSSQTSDAICHLRRNGLDAFDIYAQHFLCRLLLRGTPWRSMGLQRWSSLRKQGCIEMACGLSMHVCIAGPLHPRTPYFSGTKAEHERPQTIWCPSHLLRGILVCGRSPPPELPMLMLIPSACVCATLTLVYRILLVNTTDNLWLSAQLWICK